MIADAYISNFETMQRACKDGNVVLLECRDAKTQQPVIAVCAVSRDGEEYVFTPLARMFDGDPYEELLPPTKEEP